MAGGWPKPEPSRRRPRTMAVPGGPWSRLPPGHTIPAREGPVHPLCAHASPVRPGSDVWGDDCADLAEYSRPFAGVDDPAAVEYACPRHAHS
jgi:hypothetical protein